MHRPVPEEDFGGVKLRDISSFVATNTIYYIPIFKRIEILNNYKLSSGKTYKSDYHTILNWVIERVAKDYPQLDKPVGIQNTVYDVNVNPFDQFL